MLYKFKQMLLVKSNDSPYVINVPKDSECIYISELPEYYIFQLVFPHYLNRFKIQLPKNKFDFLDPIKKNHTPVLLKNNDLKRYKIRSRKPITKGEILIPFKSISLPSLKLGSWYFIESFKYPLLRLDSYENGIYYASVPSKTKNALIRLILNEQTLKKYRIRNACKDDLKKYLPKKLIYINKEIHNG